MSKANEVQVAGTHYRDGEVIQHWDYAASHEFDYFQGQITKYVTRWKKKNGLQDLEKAKHFLEKYIEITKQSTQVSGTSRNFVLGVLPQERISAIPLTEFIKSDGRAASGQENPFGYNSKEELG